MNEQTTSGTSGTTRARGAHPPRPAHKGGAVGDSVLLALMLQPPQTRRQIHEQTGFDYGTVNNALHHLGLAGLVKETNGAALASAFALTDAGRGECQNLPRDDSRYELAVVPVSADEAVKLLDKEIAHIERNGCPSIRLSERLHAAREALKTA